MFTVVEPLTVTSEEEPIPEWSGEFIQINDGMAIMRVHINDPRQHLSPKGWVAIGHNTFNDGSFETYIYFKMRLA